MYDFVNIFSFCKT